MSPFDHLGVAPRFDLDLAALEKTHRELSRTLHPDRFATAGHSERRASLEKAASVNEAWRVLRDPIRRAEALFVLAGLSVGETNEPKPSPGFLMEMMEERESLAEARAAKDLARVKRLGKAIAERARAAEERLAAGFANGPVAPDRKAELEKLLPLLGELRFYRRFREEVQAIEEQAEEELANAPTDPSGTRERSEAEGASDGARGSGAPSNGKRAEA